MINSSPLSADVVRAIYGLIHPHAVATGRGDFDYLDLADEARSILDLLSVVLSPESLALASTYHLDERVTAPDGTALNAVALGKTITGPVYPYHYRAFAKDINEAQAAGLLEYAALAPPFLIPTSPHPESGLERRCLLFYGFSRYAPGPFTVPTKE